MTVITQTALKQKVRKLYTLPAMPTILTSLGDVLSQNAAQVNVDRVVELLSYDESLVAQCLRMANSAMFRRRKDVESIREAVLALGLGRVRDLVFSCSIPKMFSHVKDGMALDTFWRHALGVALVSQRFAQWLEIENQEKLYLAGLLHDMGILINSLAFPAEFRETLRQAKETETPLHEVEAQVLGFTHCESGRVLAEIWKLPQDISDVIEFHHSETPGGSVPELTAVIHLADLLCRFRGLGYGYYEAREFDISSEPAWQTIEEKYPAAKRLDLERFTFEMDEYAAEVQALVDSILKPGKNTH